MHRSARVHAMSFAAVIAGFCASTPPASAVECFSMFDAKNALTYQSSAAPIDLSGSIATQMARRFPGRHLTISDLGTCPETGVAANATSTQAAALLPSRTGDGPGAFGADATSPAPARPAAPADGNAGSLRFFTRAPGGRR